MSPFSNIFCSDEVGGELRLSGKRILTSRTTVTGRFSCGILPMVFPLPPTSKPCCLFLTHPPSIQPLPNISNKEAAVFLPTLVTPWNRLVLLQHGTIIKKHKMSNYCYYFYHYILTVSCSVSASYCVKHLTFSSLILQ